MSFANLPLIGVLLGLLGLAAALFLLQQLRSRFREITLPTTMFWATAAREAPVRVFRERFRHPLAYLLLLLIAWLLWLGFAEPMVGEGEDSQYRVLFLDGSAHNSNADDFEQSVQALKADLALLPEGAREVVWGGAHMLRLLGPGENRILLDARLEGMLPEAAPSPIDEQIRLLGTSGSYPENVELVVYGRVEPSPGSSGDAGVQVSYGTDFTERPENSGIIALGVSDAESGNWELLDGLIRLEATSQSEGAFSLNLLEVLLDGEPLANERLEPLAQGSFLVRDLPASGGILEARLIAEDHLLLDNMARLKLPERLLIGVALAPQVAAPFVDLVAADPGLRLTGTDIEEAHVVIRQAGSDYGGDLPALELISRADGTSAFELTLPKVGDAFATLHRTLASLGLDQIDAQGLAEAAASPIEVKLLEGQQRGLSFWSELVEPEYNFTDSRAFPLLISRSLRWLHTSNPSFSYLAAGRALGERSLDKSLAASSNPGWQVLGAALVPPRAGELRLEPDGEEYLVALLDASLTQPAGIEESPQFEVGTSTAITSSSLMTLLILLIGLLLAFEWYLYRRGLIP